MDIMTEMPTTLTFTPQLTWPPVYSLSAGTGVTEVDAPLYLVHFAALLALIAVAVFIFAARYQRKWIKTKVKIELFDRRFLIYSAANEVINSIKNQGMADDEVLETLRVRTRDARWLFNGDIAHYLFQQVYGNARKLHSLMHTLSTIPPGVGCSEYMEKQVQLRYWFAVQSNILDRHMAPFLVIDQAPVVEQAVEPAFVQG